MYEAGVKSDLLSHRLRLNAAYFYGEYDQLQLAVVRDDGTVGNTNNSAKVHGLELEATYLPVAGLELSATVGTLNNTIDNSSKELPVAPKLTWNAAAQYSHAVGPLGVASIGASYSWTDSLFPNEANTPILEVPSHGNIDANASLTTLDGHWRFTLAGNNLSNKVYPIGGFYIAGGAIAASEWPSLPRRWSFAAQYTY
jgi:iron complex outermembrane receptor protein